MTEENWDFNLFLQEICLNNFMSYYGKHVLQFETGANYITGHCGSGRTNLAKAILFAVLGSRESKRKEIINFFHMKECREARRTSFCEVEAILNINAVTYVCKNKVGINEKDQIEQYVSVPLEVDHLISPGKYELLYIDGLSLSEEADRGRKHSDAPLCEGMRTALLERLTKNIQAGIRMSILDQVFEHFTVEQRNKLQAHLAELPMDQIIIIQTEEPELKSGYRLIHVSEYADEKKIASKIDFSLTFGKKAEAINDKGTNAPIQPNSIPKVNFETAVEQLSQQIHKIEETNEKISQSTKQTINAMRDYQAKKDDARANVFGCILAEKISVLKRFIQTRRALENITEALGEVEETVATIETLASSVEVLKRVEAILQCPLPEVYTSLQGVEHLFSHMVIAALQGSNTKINTDAAIRRAEKIMESALKDAESEIGNLVNPAC